MIVIHIILYNSYATLLIIKLLYFPILIIETNNIV